MAGKQAIRVEKGFKTPAFPGAIVSGGMVFVSGNVGMDYPSGKLAEGGIVPQTKKTIENIEMVLKEAGSDLTKLVKVNIFVLDMAKWGEMTDAYMEMVPEPRPARTCVEVSKLPLNAEVEIECIAHL